MPLLERARVEAYVPDPPSEAYRNLLEALDREFTYALAAARSGTALVRTSDLFFAAKTIKETGDQEYALACRESILNQGGKVVEFRTLPVQVQPVDKQSKLANAIET